MKFITKDTDYALRALVLMARLCDKKDKKVVTIDEILEKGKLPRRFLKRIFQRLAKRKILSSHRGKEGGFSFQTPPKKIRLIDIINIFQGDVDFTNCLLKGRPCRNVKTCVLRKEIRKFSSLVNDRLKRLTLASLL